LAAEDADRQGRKARPQDHRRDIAAARASGLSEDQIFETVVCAAVGQATRQYDTALAALKATEKD
jgi:hypothetical protein